MARAPNEKVIKAKELFKKGHKLIDIANELDVPDGTVRRWKKTYNWDNERSDKNSERSVKTNNKKKSNKEPIAEEVKEVLQNTELTDKQRLFCVIYSRCLNATKAYKQVYNCSYETAMVEGCKSLRNPKISEQIEKLNAVQFNKEFIRKSLIQKYIDIALADITDYVGFGQEEIPVMGPFGPIVDKKTKKVITKIVNTVRFRESSDVDGTIISEVKQGRDGASIKLHDKMKAMDWLANHIDLLDTATQHKLKLEEEKLKLMKEKNEIDKKKSDTGMDNNGSIEQLTEMINKSAQVLKQKDDE